MGLSTLEAPKARSPHVAGFRAFALLAVCVACQLVSEPLGYGAALLLALGGLAHGAIEEDERGIFSLGLGHAAIYLLAATAIFGFWMASPLAGLTLFLALSAWHFIVSAKEGQSFGWTVALLTIGGSALFRPNETINVFSAITGTAVPDLFVIILGFLGAVGIVFALCMGLRARRHAPRLAAAVGAVAFLQPVLAVAFVFFSLHAWPVTRRLCDDYGRAAFVKASAIPTMLALCGVVAIAALIEFGMIHWQAAAAIMVALATPHMLIDRVGLNGFVPQAKRPQNSP